MFHATIRNTTMLKICMYIWCIWWWNRFNFLYHGLTRYLIVFLFLFCCFPSRICRMLKRLHSQDWLSPNKHILFTLAVYNSEMYNSDDSLIDALDNVMIWKRSAHYWPFLRAIHQSRKVPGWSPSQRTSDAELRDFLACLEKQLNK